jgi:hypothetical protein
MRRRIKYRSFASREPTGDLSLSSLRIKDTNPPYLLEDGYNYNNRLLDQIENALNQHGTPFKKPEVVPLVAEEIEEIDGKLVLWFVEEFEKKRSGRLQILNSEETRKIELRISYLHNCLINKMHEFDDFYRKNVTHLNEPMNQTFREFKSMFLGIKWKKVKNIFIVRNNIFGDFSASSSPTEFMEYAYLRNDEIERINKYVDHCTEFVGNIISEHNEKKKYYQGLFRSIGLDLRSDGYFVAKFNDGFIRLITRDIIKLAAPRVEEVRKLLQQKELIELFNNNMPDMPMKIGGDTFLYYIKVTYERRKKPFYKIGITRRGLKERYPGIDYKKISSILFCERIENAEEIEKLIKIKFNEYSIPLDLFRNADGKTEFFDIDVLKLDQ